MRRRLPLLDAGGCSISARQCTSAVCFFSDSSSLFSLSQMSQCFRGGELKRPTGKVFAARKLDGKLLDKLTESRDQPVWRRQFLNQSIFIFFSSLREALSNLPDLARSAGVMRFHD